MRVHSVLPEALTAAVDAALAGVEHVPHADPVTCARPSWPPAIPTRWR